MRRETKTWLGRLLAALAVTVLLGYIPYHVYARSGLARTIALRRDLVALRARNGDLRAENERLAREAEALRSDTDLSAIERVARAELGWVRPGEMVVDLSAGGAVDLSAGATVNLSAGGASWGRR
jgi:cell division protein FtsB